MGESSLAGQHTGLHKGPTSLWLTCDNPFRQSIHLELVKRAKAQLTPSISCWFTARSQAAGPKPAAFLRGTANARLPDSHSCDKRQLFPT